MTWLLVALGAAFATFMAREAVTSVRRSRRVARLSLDAPTLHARYLAGSSAMEGARNVLVSIRGDDVVLIDRGTGIELATTPRPAPDAITIQSRADYEGTVASMGGLPIDDGADFSQGRIAGTDFQGTRAALARIDTVCVWDDIALLHSDRASALRLAALIET